MLSLPPHHLLSLPSPQLTPVCDAPFPVSVCSYCSTPVYENTQCLIFCSCVSLLRMMVSRFIHVPTKDTNLSLFMAA